MLRFVLYALLSATIFEVSGQSSFLDEFNFDPASPTSYFGADNYAMFLHSRDISAQYTPYVAISDHGPGCEPPVHLAPGDTYDTVHNVATYEDMVYTCRNHLMTSIRADGYGLINLMPNHLVDFSAGEAVISFDVSTANRSAQNRDWFTLAVMPFDDLNPLHAPDWAADLAGHARNMIRIETTWLSGKRGFDVLLSDGDFNLGILPVASYATLEDLITVSKTARSTFELRISQNHIRFGIKLPAGHPSGQAYHWWVDTGLDADGTPLNLNWTEGTVLFGHYSYNPRKDGGGLENTWHWDNLSISPSKPFKIIGTDLRYADALQPILTLDEPAPSGAKLIFAATDYNSIADQIDVSFDGGSSWVHATEIIASETPSLGSWGASFAPYTIDIPAGQTSLHFRGVNDLQNWMVRDVYVLKGPVENACTIPDNLGATVTAFGTAQLVWDPTPTAVQYQLQGRKVGQAAGVATALSNTLFIPGLDEGATYQWRTRAICPTSTSNWSSPSSFTIPTAKIAEQGILSISPNPASNTLVANYSGGFDGTASLYSLIGELVAETTFDGTRLEMDVSNLAEGLYLLHIGEEVRAVSISR